MAVLEKQSLPLKIDSSRMKKLSSLLFLSTILLLVACTEEPSTLQTNYSFRALATPNDQTIWVAAQNGFWAHSANGGQTWDTGHVERFNGEFRDVHAWDDKMAVLMGIGSPGEVFKTRDGGRHWEHVHFAPHPDNFFDQMEINPQGKGIILGDPINGHWTLLGTDNYGENWAEWNPTVSPKADSGEVSFAGSGSALIVEENRFLFFTGGYGAKMEHFNPRVTLKLCEDTSSTFGVYSTARLNDSTIVFVGGDYRFEDARNRTAGVIHFTPERATVEWASEMPGGYRSCVKTLPNGRCISTGPNGTDISDDGIHWKAFSNEGFHTLSITPNGSIWAAGSHGKLQKLN